MQADASQRKLVAADPTAAVFLSDLSGCGNRKIHVHEFCDGTVWPLKEPHKRISQEWTFTETNLRWSHILPLSPLSAHPQRSLVLEALNYHWANKDLFKASTKTSHFPCIVVFSCQLQFRVASICCDWLVIDVVWAERERERTALMEEGREESHTQLWTKGQDSEKCRDTEGDATVWSRCHDVWFYLLIL